LKHAEKVIKHPDRAEASRFFNYPYSALEEILVNAVFHKSYQIAAPVEIRIYVDCIKVINHPGPERYIDMDKFKTGDAISRRYRNRRIGEFLKDIDLSEKKSTGITKILNSLESNGSPMPDFETDEERNYFIVTIYPHEGFKSSGTVNEDVNDPVNDPVNDLVNDSVNNLLNKTKRNILTALKINNSATYEQLAKTVGVATVTIKRNIKELYDLKLIKRIGSDKTGHWEIVQ